jgi:Anion-transporting ATPase
VAYPLHSPSPVYLKDCLSRRTIFFSGKGGVGKSTITWATALACHEQGRRVLVAHWDPFDQAETPALAKTLGLDWLALETFTCFKEYALKVLKFEKVYDVVFDNQVLKTFLRATPGLAEAVVAGKIWDLYDRGEYDLVVVDLPSSGHAVSFFKSPKGVHQVFRRGFVSKEAERVCNFFQAPATRVDFVSLPEDLSIVECGELKAKLAQIYPLNFGFLHMNELTPKFDLPPLETLPPEIAGLRLDYTARRTRDEEALKEAQKLELPITHVPRFATEEVAPLIRFVAKTLVDA